MRFGKRLNTAAALTRFTARSSTRGAALFGLLLGGMPALQGTAYVATYPDAAARAHFIATLQSTPALGILYGDPHVAATPAGYMVYRCLAFLMLVAGLWGLLNATKLFRGQEEDGRWELLLSGQMGFGTAVFRTMVGWGIAACAAFAVGTLLVAAVGSSKDITVSFMSAAFFTFVVMLIATLFMAIGALTSQLASTRRRATVYGLLPLGIFFALRACVHVVPSTRWLSNVTPFGWAEKAQPIVGTRPLWIVPIILLTLACGFAAIVIATRRDIGDSIIREKDSERPSFRLLGGPTQLAARLNWPQLAAWTAASMGITGIITAITKTAVSSVDGADKLNDALSKLAGGAHNTLALSFIGMGTFFTAIMMLVLVSSGLAAIRHEEAKSYLDNILVRPVSRAKWLTGRVGLLFAALLVMSIATSALTVLIAHSEGIALGGVHFVINSLNILGPVVLALGIGLVLYGLLPRVASVVVYVILLWSFLVDMVGAIAKLNSAVANTSLLHHISLVPAAQPQWGRFVITLASGLILTIIGVYLFSKRDLEVE